MACAALWPCPELEETEAEADEAPSSWSPMVTPLRVAAICFFVLLFVLLTIPHHPAGRVRVVAHLPQDASQASPAVAVTPPLLVSPGDVTTGGTSQGLPAMPGSATENETSEKIALNRQMHVLEGREETLSDQEATLEYNGEAGTTWWRENKNEQTSLREQIATTRQQLNTLP